MNAETLRLFIAVELPEVVVRHIGQVIGRLRQQDLPGIRWVRPEGVHLTLKFLGNVPESHVQAIAEAMGWAVAGVAPFVLHVRGVGVFPHLRAPRVLWVGVQGDLERLVQLHQRLEEALEAQGFTKEQRAFSPHLTLGRVRGRLLPPEIQRLAQTMESLREIGPVELSVTGLSLMESRLTAEGAIYRRKAQTPLKNGLADPSQSWYTSPSFEDG